jgi:hypothetical protein
MKRWNHAGLLLLVICFMPRMVRAADDDVTEQYRLMLSMDARIANKVTGNGTLGFFANPDEESRTYRVAWPTVTYIPARWVQLTGGLLTQYAGNEDRANELELRPFAGLKLFVPNKARWTIYNYTRYEYRNIENLDTHDWDQTSRIRSLFSVEVPLSSRERAWKPKTWYALLGAEPFYDFNTHNIDQVRLSAGIGRVFTDRLRVELTYYADLTRPDDGSLAYTGNIFQLNFLLGLHEGVISALRNPIAEENHR